MDYLISRLICFSFFSPHRYECYFEKLLYVYEIFSLKKKIWMILCVTNECFCFSAWSKFDTEKNKSCYVSSIYFVRNELEFIDSIWRTTLQLRLLNKKYISTHTKHESMKFFSNNKWEISNINLVHVCIRRLVWVDYHHPPKFSLTYLFFVFADIVFHLHQCCRTVDMRFVVFFLVKPYYLFVVYGWLVAYREGNLQICLVDWFSVKSLANLSTNNKKKRNISIEFCCLYE